MLYWQTSIIFYNTESLAQRLRVADNDAFVSSAAAISLPEAKLGFKKGLPMRNPDGHVMQLIEK